jgi:hypothetical protein
MALETQGNAKSMSNVAFNVEAALRHRFRPPEYAILFEVRSGTGYSHQIRTADAVAMNLYPSRGCEIIGIEIKSFRSDWLRELKNPKKSDPVQRYCDRWYVAVPNESVVKLEELPKTWGLLVPKGLKLTVRVEAPLLKATEIDRSFLASLLRNTTERSPEKSMLEHAVQIERERIRAEYEDRYQREKQSANRVYTELRDAISEFEKASGLSIRNSWRYGTIGKAVKILLDGGVNGQKNVLKKIAQDARFASDTLEKAIEEIDALQPT